MYSFFVNTKSAPRNATNLQMLNPTMSSNQQFCSMSLMMTKEHDAQSLSNKLKEYGVHKFRLPQQLTEMFTCNIECYIVCVTGLVVR